MDVVPPTENGDFPDDVVVHQRTRQKHVRRYVSEQPLRTGDVVRLEGRYWLIESIEPDGDDLSVRARAKLARYRLTPSIIRTGVRRWARFAVPTRRAWGTHSRPLEGGAPASWEVVDQRPARDEQGEIYLELVAERDFAELEHLPSHELEHVLARRLEDEVAEGPTATLERAERMGLPVELVALDPGEEPDWGAAKRYFDALILEEIEDDLLELCGVDLDRHPRRRGSKRSNERLHSDLERFRADVEGDHDEVQQWSFRGGWIFVSVGSADDEADADADMGHGRMSLLTDSGALAVANFERVRKAESR